MTGKKEKNRVRDRKKEPKSIQKRLFKGTTRGWFIHGEFIGFDIQSLIMFVLTALTLAMIVSALTHSTPTAVIVPFIVLCAFPFLSRIITLPGLCSFFPDQLLEIYLDIKEAGLITLGSKVTTVATVIVPVYAVICLIFQPILYRVYQKVEIK